MASNNSTAEGFLTDGAAPVAAEDFLVSTPKDEAGSFLGKAPKKRAQFVKDETDKAFPFRVATADEFLEGKSFEADRPDEFQDEEPKGNPVARFASSAVEAAGETAKSFGKGVVKTAKALADGDFRKLGASFAEGAAGFGKMLASDIPNTVAGKAQEATAYLSGDEDLHQAVKYGNYLDKTYEANRRAPVEAGGKGKTVAGDIARALPFGLNKDADQIDKEVDPDISTTLGIAADPMAARNILKAVAQSGKIVASDVIKNAAGANASSPVEGFLEKALAETADKASDASKSVREIINDRKLLSAEGKQPIADLLGNLPGVRTVVDSVKAAPAVLDTISNAAKVGKGLTKALREGGEAGLSPVMTAARNSGTDAAAGLMKLAPVADPIINLLRSVPEGAKEYGKSAAMMAGLQPLAEDDFSAESFGRGAGTGAAMQGISSALIAVPLRGVRKQQAQAADITKWYNSKDDAQRQIIQHMYKDSGLSVGRLHKQVEVESIAKGFASESGIQDVQIKYVMDPNNATTPEQKQFVADTPEMFDSGITGKGGEFDPNTGVIKINADVLNPDLTTFHEVMHSMFKLMPKESKAGIAFETAKQQMKQTLFGATSPDGVTIKKGAYSEKDLIKKYEEYWDKFKPTPELIQLKNEADSKYLNGYKLNEVGKDFMADELLAEHFSDWANRSKAGLRETASKSSGVLSKLFGSDRLYNKEATWGLEPVFMNYLKAGLEGMGVDFNKNGIPVDLKGNPIKYGSGIYNELTRSTEVDRAIARFVEAKEGYTQTFDSGKPTKPKYNTQITLSDIGAIKPEELAPGDKKKLEKYLVNSGLVETKADDAGNPVPMLRADGSYKVLTIRDLKKLQSNRQEALISAIERAGDDGDPDSVSVNRGLLGGYTGRVSGKYLSEKQLQSINDLPSILFPKDLKKRLVKINEILRSTDINERMKPVFIDYNKVSDNAGNVEREGRLVSPFGIFISKKGNVLVQVYDVMNLSQNIDKVLKEKFAMSSMFDGLTPEDRKQSILIDLEKVTTNHLNGLPGETGLGLKGLEKRKFIDAILGAKLSKGDIAAAAEQGDMISNSMLNPLRNEGLETSAVRTFRLDRMNDIDPNFGGDIRMYMDYEKNKKMFAPSEMKETPKFYSELENQISAIKQDKFTPDQLRGMLRGKIKEEEMKWVGEPALKSLEGKKTITKAEALEAVKANAVRFEDSISMPVDDYYKTLKIQGQGMGTTIIDGRGEVVARFSSEKKAQEAIDRKSIKAPNAGKFSKYQLPGGENYREVVVNLPKVVNDPYQVKQDASGLYRVFDSNASSFMEKEGYGYASEVEAQEAAKSYFDGYKNAVENNTSSTRANTGNIFVSSHYPEGNYLMHMRVNDRVDSSGKKGTFIEEIQSDRHQQGREKGYSEDLKPFTNQESKEWTDLTNRISNKDATLTPEDLEKYKAYGLKNQELRARRDLIPDAPYRKDWGVQSFKRALNDAVASNHDWVGWTDGSTQGKRYKLSDQIDMVRATKWEDGDYVLKVYKDGKEFKDFRKISADEMSNTIGKELAKKISDEAKVVDPKSTNFDDWVEVSGLDLDVGSEGMKGFYDNILPKEVQKYIQKMGGKVEKGKLNAGIPEDTEIRWTEDSDGKQKIEWDGNEKEFDTEKEAKEFRDSLREGSTPIWKVNITPEMTKSLKEKGQALYQPGHDVKPGAFGPKSIIPTAPSKLDLIPKRDILNRSSVRFQPLTDYAKDQGRTIPDMAKERMAVNPKLSYTDAVEELIQIALRVVGPNEDQRQAVPGVRRRPLPALLGPRGFEPVPEELR